MTFSTEPRGWVESLATSFLHQLESRLLLQELTVYGESYRTLRDPDSNARVGALQVFDGAGLQAMVMASVDTPMLRIWQVVAFAPPTSAVPHLSFEASFNPGGCWLSLDLVPRVAVTEEPAWTAAIYEPLSDLVWNLHERADVRQSLIRARHRMRLSPWLLSLKLESAGAAAAAAEAVTAYTDRFCDLLERGVPAGSAPSLSQDALAARDAREREQLYSWDTTANYRFLNLVAGDGTAETIQNLLRDPLSCMREADNKGYRAALASS